MVTETPGKGSLFSSETIPETVLSKDFRSLSSFRLRSNKYCLCFHRLLSKLKPNQS